MFFLAFWGLRKEKKTGKRDKGTKKARHLRRVRCWRKTLKKENLKAIHCKNINYSKHREITNSFLIT